MIRYHIHKITDSETRRNARWCFRARGHLVMLICRVFQIKLYRLLPLKAMSRLWGKVNGLELPEWLRAPIYNLYIWAFGVNLEEAAVRDLRFYRNLGEFFRRPLGRGHRPVDKEHCVVSGL